MYFQNKKNIQFLRYSYAIDLSLVETVTCCNSSSESDSITLAMRLLLPTDLTGESSASLALLLPWLGHILCVSYMYHSLIYTRHKIRRFIIFLYYKGNNGDTPRQFNILYLLVDGFFFTFLFSVELSSASFFGFPAVKNDLKTKKQQLMEFRQIVNTIDEQKSLKKNIIYIILKYLTDD